MVVTEVRYVPLHTSEWCCYGAQDAVERERDERRMATNELDSCAAVRCAAGVCMCCSDLFCVQLCESIHNTPTHSLTAHTHARRLNKDSIVLGTQCHNGHTRTRTHHALQSTRSITSVGGKRAAALFNQIEVVLACHGVNQATHSLCTEV
jgi:hypothetical protein